MAKPGKHAKQPAPLLAQPPLPVHHLVARHGGRLTTHPDRRKSLCHCEERSEVAIPIAVRNAIEIASLRSQ